METAILATNIAIIIGLILVWRQIRSILFRVIRRQKISPAAPSGEICAAGKSAEDFPVAAPATISARSLPCAYTLKMRDNLEWLVYLHNGQGKAGNNPSRQEWQEAIAQAVDILGQIDCGRVSRGTDRRTD